MNRITVLLVDDHMMVREGFRTMLELENDFEVVGEAQEGRRAIALAKKLRPAVVLMDIAIPPDSPATPSAQTSSRAASS